MRFISFSTILCVFWLCFELLDSIYTSMMNLEFKARLHTRKKYLKGTKENPSGIKVDGCKQFTITQYQSDKDETPQNLVTSKGYFGRFGNKLVVVKGMLATAQQECCGISIPPGLLSDWSPESSVFANTDEICTDVCNINITSKKCTAKTGKEW